jgi:predicted esterase
MPEWQAMGCAVWRRMLAGSSLWALACARPAPTPLEPDAPGRHLPVVTAASSQDDSAQPPTSPAPPVTERDEPGSFSALPLEGLPEAIIWRRATPRGLPWIIVAHGAGGTPEDHCAWTVQRAVEHAVVCLRGLRTHRGFESYYYPEHFTLERIFLAAVAALQKAPSPASGSGVYAGYSQGATMGALMVVEHGDIAPRLLLIEGGYSWSSAQARRFRRTGGERVYFACGTPGCRQGAEVSARHLAAAGLAVQVGYAEGAGHRADGEVGDYAEAGLRWLLSTATP